MNNIAIILAAGQGRRVNSYIPKQFMSLNGKLVYQYSVEAFYYSKLFDKIMIVIDNKYRKFIEKDNMIDTIIDGGNTREKSIYNAVEYIKKLDVKNVVFHDAARPFIKSNELKQYIEGLKTNDAVITSVKITDALFHADRDKYKLIQTPEAFNFNYLKNKFELSTNKVAIYEYIFPARIKFIELTHPNLKITYPRDIYIAEQLMKYQAVIRRTPDVRGKDIVVFGGTGGIGKAVVKCLNKLEANVISLGSKDVDLSANGSFLGYHRKVDSIIYCAGAYSKDSEGIIKNYNKVMNVNFRSFVDIVENADHMIKKGGSIIAIGSTASSKGRKGIALYSASKAALNIFVEGMTEPLKEKGINIHVICPAKAATKLQTYINPNANQKEMIKPSALAKIIVGYIDIDSTGNIVYIRVGEENEP
jgi:2-C-methyl-D-erythritol 4-phosphate cytidylyltransferase